MEEKKKTSQSVWEVLSAINCNEHTEKKPTGGGKELTYLSWAWAWAEVKSRYPDTTYSVKEWNGVPYLNDPMLGIMVETSVTIKGETLTMRLPVMDSTNKAQMDHPYSIIKTKRSGETYEIRVEQATMFDVNTAIMRCLVKNLAMFGLGHYIYAGEDIPQAEAERIAIANSAQMERERERLARVSSMRNEAIGELNGATTIDGLKAVYEKYTDIQNDQAFKNAINARAKEING